MPTVRYEEIPVEMSTKFITWKSVRDEWLAFADKHREYYNNDVEGTKTLYTQEQLAKIGGLSNIPVSINYIHPVVNQKLAMMVRSKPSHKVIASSAKGAGYAQILDKMKHAVMYNSKATEQIKQFAKTFLVTGQCGFLTEESTIYKPGAFNTTVRNVDPKRYIIDPNCIDETNDDAEGLFLENKITLEKAKQLYQPIIDAINAANGVKPDGTPDDSWKAVTWDDFTKSVAPLPTGMAPLPAGRAQAIDVVDFYEPWITTAYRAKDAVSGDVITLFKENEDENNPLFDKPIDKEHNVFVRRTLMLGSKVVLVEVKAIRSLPLKVGYFEWGGSPYKSYGMIHFVKGMQEAFDKVIQLMLVNGILTNNSGWTVPVNSIRPEDEKKWQEQGNNPQVLKTYSPQVIEGQVFKPERDKVPQLGNFYPMFLQMMKDGIEYSTGVNAVLQGNSKEAGVDVFASLQQYTNAASERIIMALASINRLMEAVGGVVIDFLLEELKTNDLRTFFDEEGDFNEITVAADMMENVKTVRWQVLSVPAEAMPTQRMSFGTELLKIAQTTPDPSERSLFVNEAIKLSDMHSARGLVEKLDTVKNLQGQLAQMQEAMKRSDEVMKQMQNKALNADYRAKLADMLLQSVAKMSEMEGKMTEAMKKEMDAYKESQKSAQE